MELLEEAGIGQVLALTDLDNAASQRVAVRLGMTDEGVTERWFGLTTRQYRKVISPLPASPGGPAGRPQHGGKSGGAKERQ